MFVLFIFSVNCYAEIYQWTDSKGNIHYSDKKPASSQSEIKEITLKNPVIIESTSAKKDETRIIAWEVTDDKESHIVLAVKYYYDGRYKDKDTWLSAYTMDNTARSPHYSVQPSKMNTGMGIVNIRLGVNRRAPRRHCTNKIKLHMYGKDISTFHTATINFSKCWSNNYIPPTESKPTKGIK